MNGSVQRKENAADTYFLELRILGTILDNGVLPDLNKEDFSHQDFSILWDVLSSYISGHGSADYVLIGDWILSTTGIDKRDWLEEIWENRVPKPDLFEKYVNALKAHRDRDLVRNTLSEAFFESQRSSDPAMTRDAVMNSLRELNLRRYESAKEISSLLQQSADILDNLVESGESLGIPTGLPTLDAKLGGWQNSDLVILAARPSVGKTALMCLFALEAAKAGKRVAIASAEQPALQITHRLMAISAEIDLWRFRSPKAFQKNDWDVKIPRAYKTLDELAIKIMDDTRPTVGDIESRFKDDDIDILFVDYVQRISAGGKLGESTIYDRTTAAALGLKDIARNLDVPCVALSQINRQGTKNAGMEHLKGSGDLEQEADQVLILEREEMAQNAVLTLEKNRHGPVGSIELLYDAPCIKFSEKSRSAF